MVGFSSDKHSVAVVDINEAALDKKYGTTPTFVFMLETMAAIGFVPAIHVGTSAPVGVAGQGKLWYTPNTALGQKNGTIKLWNGSSWVDATVPSSAELWAKMLTNPSADDLPRTIYDGASVPANTLGNDSDWYVQTGTSMTLYYRDGSVWHPIVSSTTPHPSFATAAQATAGTDNTTIMTPSGVKQSIEALLNATAPTISTQAEAQAGVSNASAMSPLRTKQSVATLMFANFCTAPIVTTLAAADKMPHCVAGVGKTMSWTDAQTEYAQAPSGIFKFFRYGYGSPTAAEKTATDNFLHARGYSGYYYAPTTDNSGIPSTLHGFGSVNKIPLVNGKIHIPIAKYERYNGTQVNVIVTWRVYFWTGTNWQSVRHPLNTAYPNSQTIGNLSGGPSDNYRTATNTELVFKLHADQLADYGSGKYIAIGTSYANQGNSTQPYPGVPDGGIPELLELGIPMVHSSVSGRGGAIDPNFNFTVL